MKITKTYLREIIREELLKEDNSNYDWNTLNKYRLKMSAEIKRYANMLFSMGERHEHYTAREVLKLKSKLEEA